VLSRIFIDRPIFAWVIALVIMLSGVGGILSLPVEQYPDVAPTEVNINASYPGASAETLQNSVTQILEQQLTGVDGLLYFSSESSSRGQVSINATFEKGVNPDIAQVQVQNRVQQALSRLPAQVQQQGVRVTKSNPDFLLIVSLYDTTDQRTNLDISDYLASNLQDVIARIPGVGDTNVFGSQRAMRIWLDPVKLASFSLIPQDIVAAVQAQNAEVAAGEIGGTPMPVEQMLNATVTAQSRLQTPDQFRNIIIKTEPDGSTVRLSDIARVELGAENYMPITRANGHPGAGLAVMMAPGANALETAEAVKSTVIGMSRSFPDGFEYAFPNDASEFIKISIEEVVKTLAEAILLVVIVMFVFLQSWRATLIPFIAVPVVLLGTFGVFWAAGFSINTLTLFGLVLAIGLLVDDAIVVVENVERLMHENPGMSAREATILSMREIQMALIGIAAVLCAVFLPMAFFGGSTGVIYRQFSVTVVSAMVLSVIVALVLSPALTATLLKPRHVGEAAPGRRPRPEWLAKASALRQGVNKAASNGVERFLAAVRFVLGHKPLFLVVYAVIVGALALLFVRLPTGFLPNEDQGRAQLQFQLPAGATQARALEAQYAIEDYFLANEQENIGTLMTISGNGGQNSGRGFVHLKDWDEREDTAEEFALRSTAALSGLRDVEAFVRMPPPVRGLGQADGFTLQLQNTSGMSQQEFEAARDQLVTLARQEPRLTGVRVSQLPGVPALNVDIDPQRLSVLGLSQAEVNSTLSIAWGGRYVNDFLDNGRVKRVYVQGEAEYRGEPDDLKQWYVRSTGGGMTPFSSFATTSWAEAPTTLSRFGGVPSFQIEGQAAPGVSSGTAMNLMEELARQIPGTSVAWSGLAYQERISSGQAPLLYGLSLLVVFLCLAALYESWSIPLAVLLVVPLGLVGAVFAVTLRGLENDVFLQIGLLTTMGLAAKNAILMIEFADQGEKRGLAPMQAALEAARIRLRPILMTSTAFMFGVLPLAISTGAGANGRIAIGTAVIGGMFTATVLALFYIPLFFVLVRSSVRNLLGRGRRLAPVPAPAPAE
jgi:multidrug efflux pump